MKRFFFAFVLCIACGEASPPEPPQATCEEVEDTFDTNSGWGDADYCAIDLFNGCYPFHGASENSCKTFISMRTDETDPAQISACRMVIETLNCKKYTGELGDVTFFLEAEDRLTLRMFGTLSGRTFDTILHLNPCQPGCVSGITLDTLNDDQQKVCEIPRQGQTACLFPETAHNITFKEAGAARVNLVMGTVEHLLTAE